MAKVALLVGVSEYEPGLNPLPGAVRDVEAVYEVLLHPEMGGFVASDVILLKNPERQAVEMAIETLFSGRQKDDLLLLYFSGHGIKDDRGRLYLATRNTTKTQQGELIRSTAVSANFVHDRMSESRSRRQVVILDSCFSGAFAEGLSAKDDGTIDIRQQLGGEGRVVLTSSSSTQYSFEQQGEDLSIYTRFLIEGIKSGEADRDQDEFVSIDELHEYASQKVRELQPAMKPEIYAIREGFKIRLAKVAPGDPKQRYRKEVARFIHRGEISFVGRRTLDVLRTRLGLEPTEAKQIEDEVLEPYRNEFREKLQNYQQVFQELLERNETIADSDRQDLQNLQQILGLRNEDTMPIEAQVTAQFKIYQQNLQIYKQEFTAALRQEYPLSTASRDRLRQTQQQLELTDRDITTIESEITSEVEAYHRKLQDYEQQFLTATRMEYPLSEATRTSLRQQQQRLGLTDVDVAPIEAQITTRIESYHQKLQQYEQAFVKATQRKHYPDEVTHNQLQQTWQTLGLSDEDVGVIESRINAEIERHQANLRQYEQEFTKSVQQEYPLSVFKRSQLTQRFQALNLTAEDVAAIENPMFVAIEEHRHKLQQYEQVFREAMQFEYPLSEAVVEELRRFQQILELTDEQVLQVQQKILTQQQPSPEESIPSLTTEKKLVQEPQPHREIKESSIANSLDVTPPSVSLSTNNLRQFPESKPTQKGLERFNIRQFLFRFPYWGYLIIIASTIASIATFTTRQPTHTRTVNSVAFSGNALLALSGSDDCTLRLWKINNGESLQPADIKYSGKSVACDRQQEPQGLLAITDDAVQVSRFLPVENNRVAIGLDSGVIELRNVPTGETTEQLQDQNDPKARGDRVFDLAFTKNSLYLFSGYGSGKLRLWSRTSVNNKFQLHPGVINLQNQLNLSGFQIRALTLSPDDQTLVIAGNFNRFLLWSWNPNQVDNKQPNLSVQTLAKINPRIGSTDYVWGVDFAPNSSAKILATSDSAGYITIWNLSQCRTLKNASPGNTISEVDCPPIDSWQIMPNSPVRTLKFSEDGSLLVSGGDDGQVIAWYLTSEYKLDRTKAATEQTIYQSPKGIRSVDLKNNMILSGDEDHQVKLHRIGSITK
ncbi:MAG TPA: caspase family protein [Leptolyngbyaceae cyanobacterium]